MSYKTKITKQKKSLVEVAVTAPFLELKKYEEKAIEKLVKNIEIDGFRKGSVPQDVAMSKINKSQVLQASMQDYIDAVFPTIISEEKIKIIGYPSISVEKLDEKEGLEFKIVMTVYPDITLPDYKKIASSQKKGDGKVEEDALEKAKKGMLDMYNQMSHKNHDHKDGEKCEASEEQKELTDEFAKKIGFKDIKDLEEKVQQDLEQRAVQEVTVKHREAILEAILKETSFEVPELLVNAEKDKILAQMRDDVTRSGMKWEDYIKSSGKNEEEIRESFAAEAVKRAEAEIILKEIAKDAKLQADKDELQKQVAQISSMHKDVELDNIRLYVENILINEAVMKFLEK